MQSVKALSADKLSCCVPCELNSVHGHSFGVLCQGTEV